MAAFAAEAGYGLQARVKFYCWRVKRPLSAPQYLYFYATLKEMALSHQTSNMLMNEFLCQRKSGMVITRAIKSSFRQGGP